MPADRAQEVVSLPALTRVPGAPSHLLGVFAHRGEVIPVIDLAMLTGATVEGTMKRAVLVRVARGGLALTATRVAGISILQGPFDPLGTSGIQAHLTGPATAPAGQVAVIEPEGFFEFLARGA